MVWSRGVLTLALGPWTRIPTCCSFTPARRVCPATTTTPPPRRRRRNAWLGHGVRLRYYSDAASRRQQVTVDCRSNGSITLDIFHHATASPPLTIIYLPSGLKADPLNDDHAASALSESAEATVIRINYRSGPAHPFPTPIHDVLTGYDWVLENLVSPDPQYMRKPAKLGVCGELFGGTLATALALTECRLGGHRIGAAVLDSPIVDWLFPNPSDQDVDPQLEDLESQSQEGDDVRESERALDAEIVEFTKTGRRKKPKKPKPLPPPDSFIANASYPALPSSELLSLRTSIFPHASSLFDRFASPALFFRSPSAILPRPASEDLLASLSPPPDFSPDDNNNNDVNPPTDDTPFDPSSLSHLSEKDLAIDLTALVPTSDFDPLSFTDPLIYDNPDTTPPHFPSPPTHPQYDPLSLSLPPPSSLSLPRLTRTYHRTYPPSSTSLALPFLRLHTTPASPLATQHAEFTALVRRAVAREYVRRHGGGNVDVGVGDDRADAEELRRVGVAEGVGRVDVVCCEGGLGMRGDGGGGGGDGDGDGECAMEDVGRWFRGVLGVDG
ncbi:alpha/beta-hydrolase [Pseudovirgaria hyperparasitica]|uniref:Alpha/beta-hydrolase n=1 Tax=Pseudovirgaria hyperparasitica TaxID=470096 RepID=A0A6A6WGC4_9PEZI|nr:alpha/beta-hydrolase [Pseudovirgaria hyperparasitica]KAF2760191.1 alpha/beta-hydrolase [Pseudovirgaria hyperparasitica]